MTPSEPVELPQKSTGILPLRGEGDVVVARRTVREIARRLGFDAFGTAAITTATSELARNVVLHGGGGHAEVLVLDAPRLGIEVAFVDDGPGIADLGRALKGGWSTSGAPGLGLSGSRRLVDTFHVDSGEGRGTRIRIRKYV